MPDTSPKPVMSSQSARFGKRGGFSRESLSPWLFLMPALIIFTWFKFYPMLSGLQMSFYDVQFYSASKWVGLSNFARAFASEDLAIAVGHTAIYVVFSLVFSIIFAFALALGLEGPARHLGIIRTAIFLPAITSAAVLAQVWQLIFNSAPYGVVNALIGYFGIAPQGFLSDPHQALGTLVLLEVWKDTPYDMMIFIAGLAGINRELYDAADVDGAGWWRKLLHVTLPGSIPAISVVIILSLIRGFRVFAEVYATTGGGPAGSTETIMTYIYKAGFNEFNYGYASAVSFLLLIFTIILTLIHLRLKAWIAKD